MGDRWVSLPEAERAMKLQEVILRAAAGEISWYQAAEIIGISPRQMRRWKKRYEEEGYDGLFDRRKQAPSPRRVPMETVEKVLRLYRKEYCGYNVRHFHEEIVGHEGIKVSYSWTKNLLQTAGLVEKASKRGEYRRRRERKACTGLMLHLDGSKHRWFWHATDQYQCLLVVLDDATSEILAARFVPEESTETCLAILQEVVEEHGTFVSLYTDRASHFVHTEKAGEKPKREHRTQIQQVLDALGIELIVAYSPQARGRSERAFGTLQGRLVPELRRAGVTTYEEANQYLALYLPKHNKNFAQEPAESTTAFLPVAGADLDRTFARRTTRIIQRDYVVQYLGRALQLERPATRTTLVGRKVEVREHLNGTVEVLLQTRLLGTWPPVADPLEAAAAE